MKIATYLKFNGKCEEAFNFYKKIFKADEICSYKFDQNMTKEVNLIGKIFHAELKIEDFYIYMCDTLEDLNYQKQPYKITMECNALDQANEYFNYLKDKGLILSPLEKKPWGIYVGEVRDRFGITWDIVYC